MRAYRDISPTRRHSANRQRAGRWALAVALLMVAGWLLSGWVSVDVGRLLGAIQVGGAPLQVTAPISSVPAQQAQLQVPRAAEQGLYSAPDGRAEVPPGRVPKQTSFNADNFTPRGALNTYRAPSMPPVSAYADKAMPQQRRVHSANWQWENGHDKRRVRGQFNWVEVNGRIEWGSVCRNYRAGSFEYRDCRKGAKVAFREMCGHYRPACMAQNGFRP